MIEGKRLRQASQLMRAWHLLLLASKAPHFPPLLYFNSRCFICCLLHFFFPFLNNTVHGDCFPYNPGSTTTLPDMSATCDSDAAMDVSIFCSGGSDAAYSQEEENVFKKKKKAAFSSLNPMTFSSQPPE